MNAARILPRVGACGALLTVVILAITVLLRLTTRLEGGEMVSALGPEVGEGARIVHRIAAGAVGVLAALALVTARTRASFAVVGLTLLLALVGRYSAGYLSDAATVVNVAGGIALVAAFWRLRVPAPSGPDLAVALALGLLLTAAVFGAATDAAAMRGERAFGPLHLGFGVLFAVAALAAAWRHRRHPVRAAAIASLVALQVALGVWLFADGTRPLGPGWVHAIAACALAILLAGFLDLTQRAAPEGP